MPYNPIFFKIDPTTRQLKKCDSKSADYVQLFLSPTSTSLVAIVDSLEDAKARFSTHFKDKNNPSWAKRSIRSIPGLDEYNLNHYSTKQSLKAASELHLPSRLEILAEEMDELTHAGLAIRPA